MYLTLSSSFILSLASSGTSASGIDLHELLVSGFNCKLVLVGIFFWQLCHLALWSV